MGKYPTLEKAPIFQVLFQVKFETAKTVTNAKLISLHKTLKREYPIHSEEKEANIKFNIDDLNKSSLSIKGTRILGQRFMSKANDKEIFVSSDTYTYIQRGKYNTWDDFKESGLKQLIKIWDQLEIIKINRSSVRYLNKIEFDSSTDRIEPKDLFNTFIAFDNKMKDGIKPIGKYNINYETHIDEKIVANFSQRHVPSEQQNQFRFIVDIDVLDHEQIDPDLELLSGKLDILRDIKNDLFFNNLTEQTYKMLK